MYNVTNPEFDTPLLISPYAIASPTSFNSPIIGHDLEANFKFEFKFLFIFEIVPFYCFILNVVIPSCIYVTPYSI